MNLEIPTAPAGALVLLAFFAPYAIAALNGVLPFVKKPWQRRAVSIVVSVLLAVLVLVFYYATTGDVVPAWPAFVLLSLVITSASYGLVTKGTASKVEAATSPTIDARDVESVPVVTSLPDPSTSTRAEFQSALELEEGR